MLELGGYRDLGQAGRFAGGLNFQFFESDRPKYRSEIVQRYTVYVLHVIGKSALPNLIIVSEILFLRRRLVVEGQVIVITDLMDGHAAGFEDAIIGCDCVLQLVGI